MTTTVVFLLLIGLIVLGLQRNHARGRDRPTLAGSGTATDRDEERIAADTVWLADGEPAGINRTVSVVSVAPGRITRLARR